MVAIAPSLEVIISVRIGDSPEPCIALWNFLTRNIRGRLTYAMDDRLHLGVPRLATAKDDREVVAAFEAACHGPQTQAAIDWSTLLFQDTGNVDELSSYAASCSIGWIKSPTEPRGISLRTTFPSDWDWSELLQVSREVAVRWPALFRWLTVGYRFLPVPMHSVLFEAATEVIFARSRRFLTVDIGDLFGFHSSKWQLRLRTLSWLTLLSKELVSPLGGAKHIQALCTPPLSSEVLAEGLLISFGERPILGDVNRRQDLSAYRKLDSILHPVRADGGVQLLPPWDDEAATRAWLNRFQ